MSSHVLVSGALVLFVCLLSLVRCLPVPATSPPLPPASALKFMRQFGYLEKGTPDSEALYSQDAIVDAIKTVQKFGALAQTGELDNATLELMIAKRCGVPDIARHEGERRKRFIVGAEGWKKRNITYFMANWSPKLGEQHVENEMKRAFKTWGPYGRLSFKQIYDPNADIIVAFGRGPHQDGYPFDGPGSILAHAFYPYEMDGFGGDIHFDDDEDWKVITKEDPFEEGIDFFTVAVHELGHSLGLAHSPVSTSIMFPYYKGYQNHFQLGYDDILGMYDLYISKYLEGDHEATQGIDNDSPRDDGTDSNENGRDDDDDRYKDVSPTPDDDDSPTRDDDDSPTPDDDDDDRRTNEPRRNYPVSPTPPSTDDTITYTGDDESVDDHKGHDDKHNIPASPNSGTPDICEGDFDAVAVLRGELFVFKNEYLWRLSERGKVQTGYPVKFSQLFWMLPKNITHIDAVYQREKDGSIVLFTGKIYWIYNGDNFIEGSPRPLTDYGLPSYVDKIDAAMVWNKNGKTFFFSKDMYWRYNDTTRKMDPGYPYSISRWRGVPPNLDAAMTWTDGFTYFFKGKLFWRFDNYMIKTVDRYPLPAPQHWIACPEKPDTIWW